MKPLPARFELAATPWPRTAANRRHSALVPISGPQRGRIVAVIELPSCEPDGRAWTGGGIATGADGALIVVAHGRVSRVALDGTIRSVASIPPAGPDPRDLDEPPDVPSENGDDGSARHAAGSDDDTVGSTPAAGSDDDAGSDPTAGSDPDAEAEAIPRTVVAPPVALADGTAVVVAAPELLVFDAGGQLVGGAHVGTSVDDSVLAPNATHRGALVLTHMTGEVVCLADGQRRTIGAFGYDVVPPAIYPDDAMVIAGYAGTGLVCIAPDGTHRWRADLKDADLLPAIDADGFVAAGSLNDHRSLIVAPDGTQVGAIPRAGAFAETGTGDWFVRTPDVVARVRRDGSPLWMHRHAPSRGLGWGALAPVADAAARVYTLDATDLIARDGQTGATAFRAELGGEPTSALALVAPGLAAVLVGHRLLLIE